MDRTVVCKFNLGESKIPLPRLVTTNASKHIPEGPISDFSLAIHLWMGGATLVKARPKNMRHRVIQK